MLDEITTHAFLPRHYDVFGGLDVDSTRMAVTFMTHEHHVKSLTMPMQATPLLTYVQRHFDGQRVAFAYAAGVTGYGLYDALTTAGFRCLVVTPSMVPTAPGQRVKTNRLDSIKLASGLRGGQLTGIHVPPPPYRQLRHLTRLRDTAVSQIHACKCRIKALLLFEGIPFPATAAPANPWSQRVLAALRELPCSPAVRFRLDQLLASTAFATQQALETLRAIRALCRQEPDLARNIAYLRSIPGIGWIVASHLLARIGDWRELHRGRQLAAFLGVVAREYSSGETIHRGSITRTGDRRLRAKLIQSAWAAIRQDPELQAFYWRIYHRHPREHAARKAIVAVARKLTLRIAAVLTEQRAYVVRAPQGPTSEETQAPWGTTRCVAEPGPA